MTNQKKADLALLLVTFFWGASYYLMDLSFRELGPLTINAYRFLIGFLVIGLLNIRKMRNISKETLKYGVIIGVFLAFTYWGATFGTKYTSLSNAGFLCALSVVFTPIFGFFFKGQRLDRKFIFGLIICLFGMGLLMLGDRFKPAIGDILCIGCAVFYAFDLLLTETACQKEGVDTLQMAVIELLTVGLLNLVMCLIFEEPSLPKTPTVWGAILFLAVFCTGLSITVQAIAQKYTTASHAGLIFSLEPVFAAIIAFLFAGEVLSVRGYIGAGLMMLSIFIIEAGPKEETCS